MIKVGLDIHESYEVYALDEASSQEHVLKPFENMDESDNEMNMYTNSIDKTSKTKQAKVSKELEKVPSKKLKLFASNKTCLSQESGKYQILISILNPSNAQY